MMHRRAFVGRSFAALIVPSGPQPASALLAEAARKQLGVTTSYDPSYTRIPYPNGDVPRNTGVCADVIVRAARDALSLDLQKLVHEDMTRDFAAYPRTWNLQYPDANIDHRRVLNLEVFWRRQNAQLWVANGKIAGDDFPAPIAVGDLFTWLLDGRLPHVGIVVSTGVLGPRVVHNIGAGVQENALFSFRSHHAKGHFRWPVV
jgi:uncharacterized protein